MDNVQDLTLFPFERAFKVITQRADALLLKMVGCSRREMWVLLCINDNELSQRQIGEILGLHPNVVVKMLDEMESRKLLTRERRRANRREQIVQLTSRGDTAVHTYLTGHTTALSEMFSPLTTEQIETWRELSLLIVRKREES